MPTIATQTRGIAAQRHQVNKYLNKTYSQFEEIDWSYEQKKERQNTTQSGSSILIHGEKWVIIIVAALITGTVVSFIDVASIWTNDIRNGYCKNSIFRTKLACCDNGVEGVRCANWHDWDFSSNSFGHFVGYAASSVALAGIGACLASLAPLSAKSGIAEIKMIISGLVYPDYLSSVTLVTKAVSLILVAGAGLWLGKEGPFVHVSACIMNLVDSFVSRHPNEALKRELLAAAVATGIALAFNAPIGGVLFILEQGYPNLNSSSIMWKAFIGATVAVVLLQSVHPFTEGRNVLFSVSNNRDWLSIEIVPFMGLGVLGGAYGAVFSDMNMRFARFRASKFVSAKLRLIEVVILALITTILTYPLIFGKLPLSLLTTRLFRDCDGEELEVIGGLCIKNFDSGTFPFKPFMLLIFTGIEGFFLAAYTYGTAIPSGVLMPSLAIGACAGRSLGLVIDHFQITHPHWQIFSNCPSFVAPESIATTSCISTGAYAVVGAGSFLAGLTKTSASVVVIMFELTGALTYVLPIMMSVLVAKVVNDSLVAKSFYDIWLRFSNFYFLDQNYKNINPIPNIRAKDVMTKEVPLIYISNKPTIEELVSMLGDNQIGFPVLKSPNAPELCGWIFKHELEKELLSATQLQGFPSDHKVSFQPPEDSTFAEFEVEEQQSSFLSLYHLIESSDDIHIFRDTTPMVTIADFFYKMNYNFIIFTDIRCTYKGLITKYQMVDLVEYDFGEIDYAVSQRTTQYY